MRKGKAYYIRDGQLETYLEVVPLIPRGWIIKRNSEVAYHGIVFNQASAFSHVDSIKSTLEMRARVAAQLGKDHPIEFIELPGVCPLPQHPGIGVQKEMMASLPEEPGERAPLVKLLPAAPPPFDPPALPTKRSASKAKRNVFRQVEPAPKELK